MWRTLKEFYHESLCNIPSNRVYSCIANTGCAYHSNRPVILAALCTAWLDGIRSILGIGIYRCHFRRVKELYHV